MNWFSVNRFDELRLIVWLFLLGMLLLVRCGVMMIWMCGVSCWLLFRKLLMNGYFMLIVIVLIVWVWNFLVL